ncbi:MAG: hypothetical protein CVV41_05770 [Candidatus Riflebacteria bacterium HGW-Riflebacteria-1]|jgi:hypothetical protein|nr:MAG: hypothetical protein CVV41_05770 [Candidatus Riflebacteria bacterium HGW-Riflebacteria-1]
MTAAMQLEWNNDEIQKIWEADKLGRMASAEKLTRIISSYNSLKVSDDEDKSLTLVVKSPWGTGKTYFVKKWMETLIEKGAFCVYFSAWEAEIHKTPATYFLQSFIEAFEAQPELHSKFDSLLKTKALKALPIMLTIATIACLPVGALYAFAAKLFTDEVAKKCTAALKRHDKKQSIEESALPIKDAREHLGLLVDELAESSFENKVYVFIDELDRCKPDFAIKILEEIKHFFSLSNLVFIVSVDFNQLEGSIKHVYGSHIDCEGYLMRFVKLFYTLPELNHLQYARYLRTQLASAAENLIEVPVLEDGVDSSFEAIFASLSRTFNASLRDQQIIMTRLKLMLSAGKVFVFPTVYFMFIQLRFPAIWQQAMKDGVSILTPDYLIEHFKVIKETPNTAPDNSFSLPPKHQNLLIDLIHFLSVANDKATRAIKFDELKKGYAKRGERPEHDYLRMIGSEMKEFSSQTDLINLYSEGFK